MSIRVSDALRVMYPDSLRHVPQEALDRGTRLHLEMEIFFRNQQQGCDHTFSDDLTECDLIRVRSVMQWCREQQLVGEFLEERYDHRYGFIGHPDFVGTWNGYPWTIDWKFAETVTEANYVQGEVYRYLTNRPVALVQCRSDATIRVYRLKPRPDLWARFLEGFHQFSHQQREMQQSINSVNAQEVVQTLWNNI
ncbi:MAG: hypothetical protein NPIRA02_10840 [Nitrospirales bacterium]|nr:MAG: hypothetical protein NPIRA02_10840 [Nitrospirales bacterium]